MLDHNGETTGINHIIVYKKVNIQIKLSGFGFAALISADWLLCDAKMT